VKLASNEFLQNLTPLGLIVLLGLQGCAGVNTRTADGEPVHMSRDQFAAYVEETFRYHNRVVNDLITASSMSDEEVVFDQRLVRAEETMAEKCLPLNEMVTANIEGRDLSLWAKMRLPQQVPECEAASRNVEALMPEW